MPRFEIDSLNHDPALFQQVITDVDNRLNHITSDSQIAVLCGAWIEKALCNLLLVVLRKDKATDSLLGSREGSTSVYNQLAYCMELIPEVTYKNIQRINKIRNRFAHSVHDYTFADNEIKSDVGEFRFDNIATAGSPLEAHLISQRSSDHLGTFKFMADEIVWELSHEAESIDNRKKLLEKNQRPTTLKKLLGRAMSDLDPATS